MSDCDTAEDLRVGFQGRDTSPTLLISCTVEGMRGKMSEAKSIQIPQSIMTPLDVVCLLEVHRVLATSSSEYTIKQVEVQDVGAADSSDGRGPGPSRQHCSMGGSDSCLFGNLY